MPARNIAAVSLALTALALPSMPAGAGTCDGRVVGVRPISQYNHGSGSGFLAVRSGPGGKYRQVGEVYGGDWVEITDRRGNWYQASCQDGRCSNPLWGPACPSGWVPGTMSGLAATARGEPSLRGSASRACGGSASGTRHASP